MLPHGFSCLFINYIHTIKLRKTMHWDSAVYIGAYALRECSLRCGSTTNQNSNSKKSDRWPWGFLRCSAALFQAAPLPVGPAVRTHRCGSRLQIYPFSGSRLAELGIEFYMFYSNYYFLTYRFYTLIPLFSYSCVDALPNQGRSGRARSNPALSRLRRGRNRRGEGHAVRPAPPGLSRSASSQPPWIQPQQNCVIPMASEIFSRSKTLGFTWWCMPLLENIMRKLRRKHSIIINYIWLL